MGFDHMTDMAIKFILYLAVDSEGDLSEISKLLDVDTKDLKFVIEKLIDEGIVRKIENFYKLDRDIKDINIYEIIVLMNGSINVTDFSDYKEESSFFYKYFLKDFYMNIDQILKINLSNTTIKDLIDIKK